MSHSSAHAKNPHLAHHFDTPEQQFESGKLGMWLFLATEILLFGGLFVAYAVYRANHPEIFVYAHHYLDKVLGGINTLVLILSSLTMAWAVRAAMLGERRKLIVLLTVTILCGAGFMGIKYVEYEHKWQHGLLWGTKYRSQESHGALPADGSSYALARSAESGNGTEVPERDSQADDDGVKRESWNFPPAGEGPPGLADPGPGAAAEQAPRNVHIFFGIYFGMTGLHGLHVLAGMFVLGIMLIRSIKGHFGPAYFTPVDLSGLYWHLVDLIWIFLFPLLYLIH